MEDLTKCQIEFNFPLSVSRKIIKEDLYSFIFFETQDYYYDYELGVAIVDDDLLISLSSMAYHIQFHNKTFNTKKEARDFLGKLLKDKEGIVACRYIAHQEDIRESLNYTIANKLGKEMAKTNKEFEKFKSEHDMSKQGFVKCRGCGSLINTKYITDIFCPLCFGSLYPKETQDRFIEYSSKYNELLYNAELSKHIQDNDDSHQFLDKAKDGEERLLVIGKYSLVNQ